MKYVSTMQVPGLIIYSKLVLKKISSNLILLFFFCNNSTFRVKCTRSGQQVHVVPIYNVFWSRFTQCFYMDLNQRFTTCWIFITLLQSSVEFARSWGFTEEGNKSRGKVRAKKLFMRRVATKCLAISSKLKWLFFLLQIACKI